MPFNIQVCFFLSFVSCLAFFFQIGNQNSVARELSRSAQENVAIDRLRLLRTSSWSVTQIFQFGYLSPVLQCYPDQTSQIRTIAIWMQVNIWSISILGSFFCHLDKQVQVGISFLGMAPILVSWVQQAAPTMVFRFDFNGLVILRPDSAAPSTIASSYFSQKSLSGATD